jgi:serine/threonine protein kinase
VVHDASSDEPTLVGTTIGRYRILERIGEGGMGVVFRAVQEGLGRPVALKLIHRTLALEPEVATRFLREARIAGSLTNPNTVTIYEFGKAEDGSLYLAMELVEGESLKARIDREGVVPPHDVAAITIQVCRSLLEAHEKDIAHRDLKPENILLSRTEDGTLRVKVLDYGLARSVNPSETGLGAQVTQVGVILGTPEYMSPEQARGLPVDTRSDIYSLGIVMYEMLAGITPFESDSNVSVLASQIAQPPPAMKEIGKRVHPPRALEELVLAMIAKDPADRPADVLAVQGALEAFLQTEPMPSQPPIPLMPVRSSTPPPLEGERTIVSPFAFEDDYPADASRAPSEVPGIPAPADIVPPWTPSLAGRPTLPAIVGREVEEPPRERRRVLELVLVPEGTTTEPPPKPVVAKAPVGGPRRGRLVLRAAMVAVLAIALGVGLALWWTRAPVAEGMAGEALPAGFTPAMPRADGWAGRYETDRGPLVLEQRGDSIAGTFGVGHEGIRLAGVSDGASFHFAWARPDTGVPLNALGSGRGEGRWFLAPDGRRVLRMTLGYGTAAAGAGVAWAAP